MYIGFDSKKSREMDRYLMEEKHIPGILLMENAALGVVRETEKILRPGDEVCVFCGPGNNGGDGFAVFRGLLVRGYAASLVFIGNPDKLTGDARTNFEYVMTVRDRVWIVENSDELEDALDDVWHCDVAVDALFGTGLAREITGLYADAVHALNDMEAAVISVDIPSGVNADNGQIMGCCVQAEKTVTFQNAKLGHFLFPGAEYCGELVVCPIGDDSGAPVYDGNEVNVFVKNDPDIAMAPRKANAHKGDFGKLLVIAGSDGMAGAAQMCARAAVHSGSGLTTVGSVSAVTRVLQTVLPEVMCKTLMQANGQIAPEDVFVSDMLSGKTAVAIGPGLGQSRSVRRVVEFVLTHADIPKVLDADALNVLAEDLSVLEDAVGEIILTPHPKEFSRLSGIPLKAILENPISAVCDFVEQYDVTLVLKGAVTIIANRTEGISMVAVDVPGMAKGGSGDVLCGIIGALCAQNGDAYLSALLGAYINAMAGWKAQEKYGEYSMTPMNTIEQIGAAMSEILQAPTVYDTKGLPDEDAWEDDCVEEDCAEEDYFEQESLETDELYEEETEPLEEYPQEIWEEQDFVEEGARSSVEEELQFSDLTPKNSGYRRRIGK